MPGKSKAALRLQSEPKTKKSKLKVIGRRLLAVKLLHGNRCPPSAYAIYDEILDDGTTRWVAGNTVRTMESFSALNARTAKDRAYYKAELSPELTTAIQAANLLLQDIERACVELDAHRGLKQI